MSSLHTAHTQRFLFAARPGGQLFAAPGMPTALKDTKPEVIRVIWVRGERIAPQPEAIAAVLS